MSILRRFLTPYRRAQAFIRQSVMLSWALLSLLRLVTVQQRLLKKTDDQAVRRDYRMDDSRSSPHAQVGAVAFLKVLSSQLAQRATYAGKALAQHELSESVPSMTSSKS